MATKYRASKAKNGNYYVLESSSDGKTWRSAGDSSTDLSALQAKADNLNNGLTASGLTQEAASKQAGSTEGQKFTKADPNVKTVVSKTDAANMGVDVASLPKESDMEANSKITDENGYIDKDGNVHFNSKYEEQQAKAAKDSLANAPKVAQAAPAKKQPSDLGGRSTEQWYKDMKDSGMTDEEIAQAYMKEGYSPDGEKFKAAQAKYSTPDTADTAPETPEQAEGADTGIGDSSDTKDKSGTDGNDEAGENFGHDFNRFVIQSYLNGDFGDPKSKNAKLSMGYFILDKIATAVANAGAGLAGHTPAEQTAWSKVLEKETNFLGNDLVAKAFNKLPEEEQKALYKTDSLKGTTAKGLYENTNDKAVENAAERDTLEIKNLEIGQRQQLQENAKVLQVRADELRAQATALRNGGGYDVYVSAMNAYVGTVKGIESFTSGANAQNTSQDYSNGSVGVTVGTGSVPAKFVSGSISGNASWGGSSTESLAKSTGLTQDARAAGALDRGQYEAQKSKDRANKNNIELADKLDARADELDEMANDWLSQMKTSGGK